ncbi:MAG: MBL fold metallo-hydrolase, partial [Thermoanaerobaculia bacterium]
MIKIKFLGACGTVTGSKYLLSIYDKKYLIDCGLFQGNKETKEKNWQALNFDRDEVKGIILTHAHIDHTGFLPVLYRNRKGYEDSNDEYKVPIYCTSSTKALLHILLPDAGQLQEEEARYAQKAGYTQHETVLPLFTESEAKKVLKYLQAIRFYEYFKLAEGIFFRFHYAGHILGASILEFKIKIRGKKHKYIIFSGDLGRRKNPILKPLDFLENGDFLIVESTYGDRLHPEEPVEKNLSDIINDTFSRKGCVLIPAFAVDRTEVVLYHLSKLIEKNKIPRDIPIFVDSPMAVDALNLYRQFTSEYNQDFALQIKEKNPFRMDNLRPVRTVEESKKLNYIKEPCIIISASGMCNGGRIEHHLKYKMVDERNTILFVGYQAEGTKGRRILDNKGPINIHGIEYPIRAKVAKINSLSSHADYDEILWWLENSKIPEKVYVTHGEDKARQNLVERFKDRFGIKEIMAPEEGQEVILYD